MSKQSPSQMKRAAKQKNEQKKLPQDKLDKISGITRAKDLRIGDSFGTHKGDKVYIKELNELCHQNREPHVHIVTNHGVHCRDFLAPVSR